MRVYLADFVIPATMFGVMRLGGCFVVQGMAWYNTLIRPPVTPPAWGFMLAWTVIYFCITLCLIGLWRTMPRDRIFYLVLMLFVVNLSANVLWTYLFFAQQLVRWALFDAFVLLVTSCGLIWLLVPINAFFASLLVPYASWLVLAIYLNWQFMQLNAL